MNRAILVASAIALAPASAYTGSVCKGDADERQQARKEHREKLDRASEAIRLNPRDAAAYFDRANLYAQLGGFTEGVPHEYEKALADYDKAIELDPKFAKAYFNRGQVRLLVERKETPEMRAAYNLPRPAMLARLRELADRPERRR